MRIGIDFDNTIVDYNALFHEVAREWDVVPSGTAIDKLAIRDYLRRVGREDRWTEMQGHVYGARMQDAAVYPGAIEFLRWATEAGHDVAIISHKTLRPFLGPSYDLHAAARAWIARNLAIAGDRVFFEPTKEEKLARIAAFRCDAFIDDLPEIFLSERFPASVATRLLFDPERHHETAPCDSVRLLHAWSEAARHLRA